MTVKRSSNSIVHLSPTAAAFRGSATQLWRDPQEAMKGNAEVVAYYRALQDRAAEIEAMMADHEASNVQKKTLIKACRHLVERTTFRVTKLRYPVLAEPLKVLMAKLAAFEATFPVKR